MLIYLNLSLKEKFIYMINTVVHIFFRDLSDHFWDYLIVRPLSVVHHIVQPDLAGKLLELTEAKFYWV